jgi:inosine-uridine nucleoside N-ribohydrolase
MIEQIRKYPGQITLVVLGPAPTIGALMDKDPATFRKLKRIVTMGGSIGPMRDMFGFAPASGPMPEWNIKNDIPSQQKMYASGVPIFMMPLDSTANLKLDDVRRNLLFAQGTPITDALTLLYHQWVYGTRNTIPTLFDPMTIAFMADPALCPVTPLRIKVDDAGYTRVEQGTPNAQVCLKSDPEAFLRFVMGRLAPRR